MGIFKKKEKIDVDNKFNDVQPMSGGTLYETYNKLKIQQGIDISTIPNRSVEKDMKKTLKMLNTKYLQDFTMQDYYLLMLHSNYFCSTIIFNCNKPQLKRKILEIIRYAWLNGKAGLYFDTKVKKAYGIIINNIERDYTGDIIKIEYWDMSLTDNLNYQDLKNNNTPSKIIEGEDCKNVSIFKWGTLAISAYIIYYPFVRFQNQLLKMGIAQSFGYNKKYSRYISNPDEIIDDMELWFDSTNIFITHTDESNRFKVFENTSKSSEDFITFYKEVIGMYYALFGRRMNLDFKRERNTVEEVSLTSGAIDNIERDWLNEFELFCEDVIEINKRLKYIPGLQLDEIKLNNWVRNEMESGIFEDNDANNIKQLNGDNNGRKN